MTIPESLIAPLAIAVWALVALVSLKVAAEAGHLAVKVDRHVRPWLRRRANSRRIKKYEAEWEAKQEAMERAATEAKPESA